MARLGRLSRERPFAGRVPAQPVALTPHHLVKAVDVPGGWFYDCDRHGDVILIVGGLGVAVGVGPAVNEMETVAEVAVPAGVALSNALAISACEPAGTFVHLYDQGAAVAAGSSWVAPS